MKSTTWPAVYHIRVRGCIAQRWEQWLDGMAIGPAERPDETVLTGRVADQAALLGLLQKLANLGLTLLEVAADEGDPAKDGSPDSKEGSS